MVVSKSIASKTSHYLVLAIFTLVTAALAYTSSRSLRLVKNESENKAALALSAQTSEIEMNIATVQTAVENMIWIVKENKFRPDYMYKVPETMIDYNDIVMGSAVAFEPSYYPSKGYYYAPYMSKNPDGSVTRIQLGNDSYDYFSMDWYRVPATTKKNSWCSPYFDEGGGEVLMTTYSVPLWDDNGNVFAVVTADVSIDAITASLYSLKLTDHSYSIILDSEGKFISHPDKNVLMNETIITLAKSINNDTLVEIGKEMMEGKSGNKVFKLSSGKRYAITFAPLSNGWSSAIISPYEDIFKNYNRVALTLFLVAIFDLLLLLVVIRLIVARMTQPITEMAYTAFNIAKGNFNANLPDVSGHDEITLLRDSLHCMQRSVNSYIHELKATTAAKQHYESELGVASGIQNGMLSKDFSHISSVDLFAMLQPAKEVGGDLYDFFEKDGKFYFAIGDVSGKGVPAAMLMALTKSAYRMVSGLGKTTAETVSLINDMFSDGNKTGMFVTMFLAELDIATGQMRYCNAGHNPIMIVSPDGSARFLKARPNLAAGVFAGFNYVEETLTLEKGSRLLLYTDGVTEAEKADQSQYGEDALLAFAASRPADETSERFVASLFDELKAFADGNDQNDDITIMSIRV